MSSLFFVFFSPAAFAAGYLAFKNINPDYASELLTHARQLYDFGERCPGDYIVDGRIPAGEMYNDKGKYHDEEAWASIWLYMATQEEGYLIKTKALYDQYCSEANGGVDSAWNGLSWANKAMGVNLLMYQLGQEEVYAKAINAHLSAWMNLPKTPKG